MQVPQIHQHKERGKELNLCSSRKHFSTCQIIATPIAVVGYDFLFIFFSLFGARDFIIFEQLSYFLPVVSFLPLNFPAVSSHDKNNLTQVYPYQYSSLPPMILYPPCLSHVIKCPPILVCLSYYCTDPNSRRHFFFHVRKRIIFS